MDEAYHREYKRAYDFARSSPYMDYPYAIGIETAVLCSARCTFCTYPDLERKGERMSDELIAKLVDDMKAIPKDLAFNLFPFKVNDPFSEKRLIPLLHTVNRELPNARICLITNGHLLTPQKLDELLEVASTSFLAVSVNDHRREPYEKLMGLPYTTVMRRLDHLHEQVVRGRVPFPISLTRVEDHTSLDDEFAAWCAERYPAFFCGMHPLTDWVGQVDGVGAMQAAPDLPCLQWFHMSIMVNGKVVLCCSDGVGEHVVGDVSKQSLLDVYNAPAFRRYREGVASRLETSPCNKCTVLAMAEHLTDGDLRTDAAGRPTLHRLTRAAPADR